MHRDERVLCLSVFPLVKVAVGAENDARASCMPGNLRRFVTSFALIALPSIHACTHPVTYFPPHFEVKAGYQPKRASMWLVLNLMVQLSGYVLRCPPHIASVAACNLLVACALV